MKKQFSESEKSIYIFCLNSVDLDETIKKNFATCYVILHQCIVFRMEIVHRHFNFIDIEQSLFCIFFNICLNSMLDMETLCMLQRFVTVISQTNQNHNLLNNMKASISYMKTPQNFHESSCRSWHLKFVISNYTGICFFHRPNKIYLFFTHWYTLSNQRSVLFEDYCPFSSESHFGFSAIVHQIHFLIDFCLLLSETISFDLQISLLHKHSWDISYLELLWNNFHLLWKTTRPDDHTNNMKIIRMSVDLAPEWIKKRTVWRYYALYCSL